MARTRGFTLIELMVVIAIIAVLAVLAIPAIGLARREMAKVKCSNNLRQIGMGIETYRMDRDEIWPGRLVDLFERDMDGPYHDAPRRILVCPSDASQGTSGFNRIAWPNYEYEELREDKELLAYHVPAFRRGPPAHPTRSRKYSPLSYMYECSEQEISDGALANDFYDDGSATPPTAPANLTWVNGKRQQQRTGNLGQPFPTSFLPVLRCYWHHRWTRSNARTDERVINLSWDLNTFKSLPFWEHTINPGIPLPDP